MLWIAWEQGGVSGGKGDAIEAGCSYAAHCSIIVIRRNGFSRVKVPSVGVFQDSIGGGVTGAASAGSSTGFLEQNAGETTQWCPAAPAGCSSHSCPLPALRGWCVRAGGDALPSAAARAERRPGEEHSEMGMARAWVAAGC